MAQLDVDEETRKRVSQAYKRPTKTFLSSPDCLVGPHVLTIPTVNFICLGYVGGNIQAWLHFCTIHSPKFPKCTWNNVSDETKVELFGQIPKLSSV